MLQQNIGPYLELFSSLIAFLKGFSFEKVVFLKKGLHITKSHLSYDVASGSEITPCIKSINGLPIFGEML